MTTTSRKFLPSLPTVYSQQRSQIMLLSGLKPSKPSPLKRRSPYSGLCGPTWFLHCLLSTSIALPSLLPLCLAQFASVTPASLLFLQCAKNTPASGSLHLLFPLLSDICLAHSLASFRSQLKRHFISEAFPDHPIWNSNHPSVLLSLLACCIFIHSIYYHLT